jgi:hypothetical protein
MVSLFWRYPLCQIVQHHFEEAQMSRNYVVLISLVVLSLLLSSCGPGQLFGLKPTVTPTATATPIPPTATPTTTPLSDLGIKQSDLAKVLAQTLSFYYVNTKDGQLMYEAKDPRSGVTVDLTARENDEKLIRTSVICNPALPAMNDSQKSANAVKCILIMAIILGYIRDPNPNTQLDDEMEVVRHGFYEVYDKCILGEKTVENVGKLTASFSCTFGYVMLSITSVGP